MSLPLSACCSNCSRKEPFSVRLEKNKGACMHGCVIAQFSMPELLRHLWQATHEYTPPPPAMIPNAAPFFYGEGLGKEVLLSQMSVEAAVSVREVLPRSMSCPPSIMPHRSTLNSSSSRAASKAWRKQKHETHGQVLCRCCCCCYCYYY